MNDRSERIVSVVAGVVFGLIFGGSLLVIAGAILSGEGFATAAAGIIAGGFIRHLFVGSLLGLLLVIIADQQAAGLRRLDRLIGLLERRQAAQSKPGQTPPPVRHPRLR